MPTEETATRIRIERLETEVRDLKKIIEDLEARLKELEKNDRARVPFMGGTPNLNKYPGNQGHGEIDHPRGPQI